ncbi:hypothetical protein VTJ83DRAFT_5849 [Remersonia thermophila]|uniref:Uncharacterized protein n=1 Tax=Remersonia thermophila TaxID=72144 RepID=A0ABR4D812_9PEZI
MANHGVGGPSLAQARNTRPTPENHHHRRRHRRDLNGNHHRFHHLQHGRFQSPEDGTAPPHVRSPSPSPPSPPSPPPPPPPSSEKQLHGRQIVVIQTVSLVHYVDAVGAVTSVKTLTSDPAALTSTALPAALPVAGTSAVSDASPSVSFSADFPEPTDGAPSTSSSSSAELEATDFAPEPTSVISTPLELLTSITSADSIFDPSTSALPETSETSSAPNPSFYSSNYTFVRFSNSTRTASSSSSRTRTRFTSTTTKTRSLWTSTTVSAIETAVAAPSDNGANVDAVVPSPVPPPAEPSPEPFSGLPPQTRNTVIGGVVGSVAGIALIVFALLYLLKWRRQRSQGIMLLTDAESTVRRRPSTAESGDLARRRSGTFSVHAALAKLNSWRTSIAPAPEAASQEKGFYRVSGKKLISVLESGGDGYSDPIDSDARSMRSAAYRDSQMTIFGPNQPPLQLGSPMRPQSGVLIFREGPQRTAVQEQPPLSAQRHSTFPTTIPVPVPDSIGHTWVPRDGSRGSGSRFTERVPESKKG